MVDILGRFAAARRFFAPQNNTRRNASTADELESILLGGRTTKSGAHVTPDSAMRTAAVFACVRVLSESIAMLPVRLTDKSGEVPRPVAGPIDDLVRFAPNRTATPFEFFRYLVTCLLLRGNFYAFKMATGTAAGRLVPLHPDLVTPEFDDATAQMVYVYRPGRGRAEKRYRQKDILHVKGLSADGVKGMSVISAAQEAIGAHMQAETHSSRLFSNGAQPGIMLEHPTSLSPDAAKRLKESFDSSYAGADNAHRTVVLEDGMKVSKLGMTPDELQFIESRKFQRSEIAMFFGVPPHMIGDIERGTSWGSGIEQQGIGFVTYTLMPWLTNIVSAFDRDLLTLQQRRQGLSFAFDTDDLTKADFKTRQEGLKIQYDAGVVTPAQWAAREGQEYNPQQQPQTPANLRVAS